MHVPSDLWLARHNDTPRVTTTRRPKARRAMAIAPLKEAPLTTEVALATSKMRLSYRDPADTFLAATAKVFELTLVTTDARMLTAKGISLLPNR